MTPRLYRPLMACALALALPLGLASCSDLSNGEVSVLGPWTGTEEQAFKKVLQRFRDKTGIRFSYQGTRAVDQVLESQVQAGSPPDVAAIWSPSELTKYARTGDLHPLNGVLDAEEQKGYRPQWLLAGPTSAGRPIYSVPIKANLKSVIWADPVHFRRPWPRTWNELLARSRDAAGDGLTPWCLGMGDSAVSGWPGTDWIEDILLHRSGPDVYQRWAGGRLRWRSPEVTTAWREWGKIATRPGLVRGGVKAALLTNFQDASRPMFDAPPGCVLDHQPSFAMNTFQGYRVGGKAPVPGTNYDFFLFPAFDSPGAPSRQVAHVSVDLAGMFNDTPEARRLMAFLATPEGQEIWPGIRHASAFSLNTRIGEGIYGTGPEGTIGKKISRALLSTDRALCFDASDSFPATMRNAFTRAILEYLNKPEHLSALLTELDRIRSTIAAEEWVPTACGTSSPATPPPPRN